MARQRFVWIDGRGLVEIDPNRKPRPRVAIHGDNFREPIKSMADGKMYDSRSRYLAEVKARGYEVLGDAKEECIAQPWQPREWKDDLLETAQELGYGDVSDHQAEDLPDNYAAMREVRLGQVSAPNPWDWKGMSDG